MVDDSISVYCIMFRVLSVFQICSNYSLQLYCASNNTCLQQRNFPFYSRILIHLKMHIILVLLFCAFVIHFLEG